jgi:hypothetical protein
MKNDGVNKYLDQLCGTIIFRELDGDIQKLRIVKYSENKNVIIARDDSGNSVYLPIDILKKFKILQPDGLMMISAVSLDDKNKYRDVIVTVTKELEVKLGHMQPYAICRQSITDIFYNILCNSENEQIAGLSVNRDNCPTNFDMGIMMQCFEVLKTVTVHFYRKDTLDDILDFINTREFDKILEDLYMKHAKSCGDPKALVSKEHQGWCKSLKILLKENNFQSDINEMLGITDLAFKLDDYIIEKPLPDESKGDYYTVTDDLKLWLSGTFRIWMNDITILEYDHDINLADLNNARYFMLRDSSKKLYICVYTIKGEYLESDLQDLYEKKSFIDEWRLDFIDKYKKSRKIDSIN